MAMIRQLPSGKWNTLIRREGHPTISITRELKSDVERAARDAERALENGVSATTGDLKRVTVHEMLQRYKTEVSDHKRSWRTMGHYIAKWCEQPWALSRVSQNLNQAMQAHRDLRLATCKPQTVRKELSQLSAAFNHAIKEWHWPIQNPIAAIKRPRAKGRSRDVIWTPAQLQVALDYYKFDAERAPVTTADYMGWVIALLRYTGLRLGSVCRMNITTLRATTRVLDLPGAILKNGEDFACPFDERAEKLLRKLAEHRKGHDRFIEPTADVMSATWTNTRPIILREHPEMVGLRLHDLRHTFTTEKAPLVKDPMTLAKMTGRKDLKEMMAYYNPDAVALSELLNTTPEKPSGDMAALLAQLERQQTLIQKLLEQRLP